MSDSLNSSRRTDQVVMSRREFLRKGIQTLIGTGVGILTHQMRAGASVEKKELSPIDKMYTDQGEKGKYMLQIIKSNPELRMMVERNPNNTVVIISPTSDRTIFIANPFDSTPNDNNQVVDTVQITKSTISGFLRGVSVPGGVWKVNSENLINRLMHTYRGQGVNINEVLKNPGQISYIIQMLEEARNDISKNGRESKYNKDTKLFTPIAQTDGNGDLRRNKDGTLLETFYGGSPEGMGVDVKGERGLHDKYGSTDADDQDSNGCGRLEFPIAQKLSLDSIDVTIENLRNILTKLQGTGGYDSRREIIVYDLRKK